MQNVRVVLLGWGGVGQSFAAVAKERAAGVRARHRIDISIVGVRRSNSELRLSPGQDPASGPWTRPGTLSTLLADAQATVVVQAIPSDEAGSAAACQQVLDAFDAGADVVTATKSHLVTRWRVLEEAAEASRRAIRVSAAAGAALPMADLSRRALRGFPCSRLRGSLNGTTNFVLNELAGGVTLGDAIARARANGIAETDPSGDLSGRDAAAKLVIAANLLWGRGATVADVAVEGIESATGTLAAAAASRGRALRSVATALHDGLTMWVRLEDVADGDPLHRLPGSQKAVEFDCGSAGSIVLTGGESSRRGAALAMLKDVINLATGDRAIGFG